MADTSSTKQPNIANAARNAGQSVQRFAAAIHDIGNARASERVLQRMGHADLAKFW